MARAFHGVLLARLLELCDIDRVYLGVTPKNFKITENHSMTELNRLTVKSEILYQYGKNSLSDRVYQYGENTK